MFGISGSDTIYNPILANTVTVLHTERRKRLKTKNKSTKQEK